jgi:hypothetical protein
MRIAPHEFLQRPFDLYRFVPIISGVKRVMSKTGAAAQTENGHESQEEEQSVFHNHLPLQKSLHANSRRFPDRP